MGTLSGVFVSTDEKVKFVIGKTVDFGEVLGKHSQCYGVVHEDDIKLLTEDQEFIDKTIAYGVVPAGYDPVAYYKEQHMYDSDEEIEDGGGWPFDD